MSKSFKYVKDFDFPESCGFSGSAGRTMVKGYARGGVKAMCKGGNYAEGGSARVKNVISNERSQLNRVEAKRRDAGDEIRRVRSEMRYDKNELRAPKGGQGMHPNIGALGVVGNKNPGETSMNTAPALPGKMMMKKGGSIPKKGAYKIGKVMGEFKSGDLHSGSKEGPKVKNRKQALAIAISEARAAGKKK